MQQIRNAPECDGCRRPLPQVEERWSGPDWQLLCIDCAAEVCHAVCLACRGWGCIRGCVPVVVCASCGGEG